MHMVLIKANLSDYRHAHPEPRSAAVSDIRFRQVLDEPGRYKIFAQFRPVGTSLPHDEALLAEFYLNVVPAKFVSSAN